MGITVVLLDDTDGVEYDVFVPPIKTVLLGCPNMVVMLEPGIKGVMVDVVKGVVVGAFVVVGGTVVVDVTVVVDGTVVVNGIGVVDDMVVDGMVVVGGTVVVVDMPTIGVN